MNRTGFLLFVLVLAGLAAARPISQSDAMRVAAQFTTPIYGPSSAGTSWPYEDVAGQPAMFLCERLLGDNSSVTVMVGARTDVPPVLLYYRGRPFDAAVESQAQARARAALAADGPVRKTRAVYYSPFDIWFEYSDGSAATMISVRDLAVCEPRLVTSVRPLGYTPELAARFEAMWADYRQGQAPFDAVDSHRIAGVADWDWHWGCAPTAAANVLTYWDSRGYPLLVDSVMWLYDRLEYDWDSVPNVSLELVNTMATDTMTGSTLASSIAPGIMQVANNPTYGNNYLFNSYLRWNDLALLVNEINNDRPGVLGVTGHPLYGNHAVTWVGWGPPDTNWVCIHDEWPGAIDTVIVYIYGPGPTGIIPVIPGGAVAPDVGVTSMARPFPTTNPGLIVPTVSIANFGNSYDTTRVFVKIERPGGGIAESFSDTLSFPPAGWSRLNPDLGLSEWNVGTANPNTPPGYAICTREATLMPNDDWLVTRKLRVRPNDTLTFWYRSMGIYPESIEVWVSYTDSSPASFVDAIQAFDFTNQTWQMARALFTGIRDTTCYVGFRYGMRIGLAGTGICLDDINLRTAFYSESTRVTVTPGNTASISFPAWNAKVGHYAARCSAYQAGDVVPANDVLRRDVAVVPAPPPPANWHELAPVPSAPSGSAVRDGGSLAYMAGTGLIYAIKGNKTGDFYSYDPAGNVWTSLVPVPTDEKGKLPKAGASIVADAGRYVYAVKGNNTVDFYRYDVNSHDWYRLPNVPAAPSGKRVKAGDMVLVPGAGTDYIYLLKGSTGEFYRYNTTDTIWETKTTAPNAYLSKWNKGSFLTYDGAGTVFAHKPKYHEFWAYDVAGDAWRDTMLPGMPFQNSQNKNKKSKDGACGTWYNGNMYAFKGGNTQEFWRYNAAAKLWTESDTLPQFGSAYKRKRVKNGGDMTNIGNVIYAFKGNKTLEFWTYVADTAVFVSPQTGREGVMAGAMAISECRMAISPNPLTGGSATISYSLPKHTAGRLEVVDAAGRVLHSSFVPRTSSLRLDLRSMPAGVYLVKLSSGGYSASRKLVVQR